MIKSNQIFQILTVCFVGLAVVSTASAQDDAVYRIKSNGKVSRQLGKIENIGKLNVTISGRTGSEKIPAWEIEKISAANEPAELDRARDRIESGNNAEAFDLLDQTDKGFNPITDAEIDWYRALATANTAFAGGNISSSDAASVVRKFLSDHKDTFHYVPATDLLGRLALASGELPFASKQFNILTKSTWPEYVAKGYFMVGEVGMRSKKYAEAAAAYDKILALSGNDDITQHYKKLAQVQKAKADAMTGDPNASIAALEKIIKLENPDDKELFAYAYNALGACYLKLKNSAEAEEKFLFTHLLFDTEATPHAEAVFELASIWSDEKRTDLASEARQIIASRYRNTWWPSQLN